MHNSEAKEDGVKITGTYSKCNGEVPKSMPGTVTAAHQQML